MTKKEVLKGNWKKLVIETKRGYRYTIEKKNSGYFMERKDMETARYDYFNYATKKGLESRIEGKIKSWEDVGF